jgi:hypothetical protein
MLSGRIYLIGLFLLLIVRSGMYGQMNSPVNREICLSIEKDMNGCGEVFFSSWRPFLQENTSRAVSGALAWNPTSGKGRSWIYRKAFTENLFMRKDTGYFLFLDPLFDFTYGKESGTGRSLYVNTRGVRAGGKLGKNFAFETEFYENQSVVPVQVDDFTAQWKVMPGQGNARRFKDTGWDFSSAAGYISWSPTRSQNIQFGHGKHFVGDGYRSLLLSDNTFNYPYIKYACTFGRWQYVRTVASFMNIIRKIDIYEYPKKTAGFNYLTFNAGKRVQVSLFEANIWQNPDSTGRFKPTFGIFNPLILTNTLFTGSRSNIHSLTGLNLKVTVLKNIILYGQAVFDDVMNTFKKSGWQAGMKYFDVLDVEGLFMQVEYNRVEKETYSFAPNTPISCFHYNQALAHPLGNNFREMAAFASYDFKRFRFEYRLNIAGEKDRTEKRPVEFAVYDDQEKVTLHHIRAAWVMNLRTMMQFVAGYVDRNETSPDGGLHTGTFYIAFRTNLRNRYYDF